MLFGQTRVGIITDLEENVQTQFIINELINEIDKTTGVNLKIQTSGDIQFFDISSESEVQDAYQKANANLIISIGGLSTTALAKLSTLPTPVIGLGVIDPSLQDIPFKLGKSGKENFTYLLTSRDIIEEIESFQKLAGFERVTLLIDPALNKTLTGSTRELLIDSIQNELNVTVDLAVARTPDETKSSLAQAEAVYLSSMISRTPAYIAEIANYLIEKNIPSFSTSKQHVEAGILGSSSGNNGPEQVIRRIGIMADDILSGRNAAEIPVEFSISESFYLNIETAQKMGFSVPFEVLLTANLVGEKIAKGKTYSFSEIANLSLEENLNIKISYQDIDIADLDIRASRASILPQLSSGLSGTRINEDRANAAINSPEKSLNLDLTLSQVIYSEEAIAAIKISKYLKTAQEYQTQVDVLNVLLDTYNAYLDVLAAKTNLAIQRENLENTRTNLELAKVRVDIGSSNTSDLYRWESELANATQSVIEAQAGLIALKLQLNNLLANRLEDVFEVIDIGLEDELYTAYKNGPLNQLITTPQSLKVASDFLVDESIANNPNKLQLLENIKASERQLKLNKRLLYVPTIALQAQTSEVLARGGEGSENPPSDPNMPSFGTGLVDNSWSAGVSISYPIFTGLSRSINKQKSQVQLDQLSYSNTSLDQGLELSIRSGAISLLSATTNLSYSRQSAESAVQNFKLVQNNYKAGNVNITQLIDAQQAALSAQLAAALSIYDFIAANLQIEYALGFFSMFQTEEELTNFQNRFLEYVSNK